MKKIPIKLESISVGLSPSLNFQFIDDIEKRVFKEILVRSADKRFLTSGQCCSNCTKYAIESIIEYRIFLVDKAVELANLSDSKLLEAVNVILDELRNFLSISEQYDIQHDYRYLSQLLDTLRQNILKILFKICSDLKAQAPESLFTMMKQEPC